MANRGRFGNRNAPERDLSPSWFPDWFPARYATDRQEQQVASGSSEAIQVAPAKYATTVKSAAPAQSAAPAKSVAPQTASGQFSSADLEAVNPIAAATCETECDECEQHIRDIFLCNVCRLSFCDPCWGRQTAHKRGRKGPGGIPHEKTERLVAEKVQKVLEPPKNQELLEELYRADEITSWFGIERPEGNAPPMFQDYGRFAALMASTDPVRNLPSSAFLENAAALGRDRRTPSLVSFVGQTGAGKSTLVKFLIEFALKDSEIYLAPVIGSPGAHLPTSEDVHLYLDPNSAASSEPLLYADCEGLEGGEREPLGAKFRKKMRSAHDKELEEMEASNMSKGPRVVSDRVLEWASGPRERSRGFAVTNLYPRLLYTFSDAIVFVLRNPRTIETVFDRLITWASAAIETSSNQPVLPHAIIALNASEHDIDEKLWDVASNTESILESLAETVNRNATFKKWAHFWRVRGKRIDSLVDLVLCYYSSVQIIRVPREGRPKLMQEQIEKLYRSTKTASVAARAARSQLRMLLDVDDLQEYLQEAFSHYSMTLETPFDFVQASFRNLPIPPDFGGNILKLALSVADMVPLDAKVDAQQIWSELSYMVASCIMLDNARHKSKGSASQIFPKYINHLDDAIENFCDHHWPCEYVNSKKQRCVNVRAGHESKGHQAKDGKVFETGHYVSTFSFENNSGRFKGMVYSCLVQLLGELAKRVDSNGGFSEEQSAASIHRNMVLSNFYLHTTGGARHSENTRALRSHTACFCCLFEQAEHALPCGHVLCTACVNTFGKWKAPNDIEIRGCPIEDQDNVRFIPWDIRLKPRSAGVRVLTLDGGGIRGIVELEALKQIENIMGGKIPIQCFFDLIVGTSTGGIVALGLSMDWSVDECIEKFESLCQQAFTKRAGITLPIIGAIVENYHHSKYQTSTLEGAFTEAFSEDIHLFGGHRPVEACGSSIKVAVTATSVPANRPYLLANYNRPVEDDESGYHFQRPERIEQELKMWEAARATSAAPRYFKPFRHEASRKTYIDGAILHNNPIRVAEAERKVLWPEQELPDILLSLGTGSSMTLDKAESERMAATKTGLLHVSHGAELYNILKKNMEATLDCERAWNDYFSSMANTLKPGGGTSRFVRINPALEGHVPALDEKDKMDELRRMVRSSLLRDPSIGAVAQQLVASSFYFQLASPIEEQRGKYVVQGKILCRLQQPSREIIQLGKYLQRKALEDQELAFLVWEESEATPLLRVGLSQPTIDGMTNQSKFDFRRLSFFVKSKVLPTQMHLCFGRKMFPISGFPRSLFSDETSEYHPRMQTAGSSLKPMASLRAQGHGSSRYARRSRRGKKGSTWVPPDLKGSASLTNLQHYASPEPVIGSDIVTRQTHGQASYCRSAQSPQTAQPKSAPLNVQGSQDSRRTTWHDAFRALLWPVRARRDTETQEYGVLQFQDYQPEAETVPPSMSSPARQIQYYSVNSEDNEVYQQWVNSVGAGLGRWVPVLEMDGSGSRAPAELHGESVGAAPVELPA